MNQDIFELPKRYKIPYWISTLFILMLVCYVKGFHLTNNSYIFIGMYLLGAQSVSAFLFNKTMIFPGSYFEPSDDHDLRLFVLIVGAIPIAIFSLVMI